MISSLGANAEWRSAIPIELFTSQGCNTCPPADSILFQLSEDKSLLPLAFHVDYWNHLGWTDVFSHELFTLRQVSYARGIGSRKIYTPQVVVNGSYFLVGSDEVKIRRAIMNSRSLLDSINMPQISFNYENNSLRIQGIHSNYLKDLKILYVLFNPEIVTTEVKAGENRGQTLENSYVVNDLSEFAPFEVTENEDSTISLQLEEKPICQQHQSLALLFQATNNGYPSTIQKAYYTPCQDLKKQ